MAVQKKQETSPGFWSKVWNSICGLFGKSTPATGSSNKPGGDAEGIGGSPSLEMPFSYDLKKFIQLLEETRHAFRQVQETNETAEEELNDSEKSIERLIKYLKAQQEIYGEAAVVGKVKLIFDQKVHRTLRKDVFDVKGEVIESAKRDRFWGKVSAIATLGTVAITVSIVALSVIPTGGGTLPLIPTLLAMGGKALSILQPAATLASGSANIMKGFTDYKLNEHKSHMTLATHKETQYRMYKVPSSMKRLNECSDSSMRMVTQHLKRIEENRDKTIKSLISAAPAA